MTIIAKAAGALAALGLAACLGAWLKPERECPAIVTREVDKSQSKAAAAAAVIDAPKFVAEVKPKTTIRRRPVLLPGPLTAGCPTVGVEEEIETTADSRITHEATRIATQSIIKETSHETERTVSAPARSDWTFGVFALRPLSGLLDGGQWGAGAHVSRRLVGPVGAALVGQRSADGRWFLGVGLNVSR